MHPFADEQAEVRGGVAGRGDLEEVTPAGIRSPGADSLTYKPRTETPPRLACVCPRVGTGLWSNPEPGGSVCTPLRWSACLATDTVLVPPPLLAEIGLGHISSPHPGFEDEMPVLT